MNEKDKIILFIATISILIVNVLLLIISIFWIVEGYYLYFINIVLLLMNFQFIYHDLSHINEKDEPENV